MGNRASSKRGVEYSEEEDASSGDADVTFLELKLPEEARTGFKMLTMLVNFLLGESKTILLFLLGYRGVVQGAAYAQFSKQIRHQTLQDLSQGNINVTRGLALLPLDPENNNFPGFLNCMMGDISGAMGTFNSVYVGQCLEIHSETFGNLGYLTIPVVIGCLVLILVELALVTKFYIYCCANGLHSTFNSGRYLQFVWNMYRSTTYKVFATLLLGIAFACVFFELYLGIRYGGGFTFVLSQALPMFGVVMGAKGIAQTHIPAFAKENALFGRLVFKRSCLSMLLQDCNGFASDLQHALYRAQSLGDMSELESLVDYKVLGFNEFDASAQKAVIDMIVGPAASNGAVARSFVAPS